MVKSKLEFIHIEIKNVFINYGVKCMPKKVAILGSNALKTSCNLIDNKILNVCLYAPRLSISNFATKKSDLKFTINDFSSSVFENTVLERDIKKTLLGELIELNPDAILIDFSEEFYPLLVSDDGVVLTLNGYLRKYINNFPGYRVVEAFTEEWWRLWTKGSEHFVQFLYDHTFSVNIVEIFQPRNAISCSNKELLNSKIPTHVETCNENIFRCYSVFKEMIKCKSVAFDRDNFVGDGRNNGALKESVYVEIAQKVCQILNLPEMINKPLRLRIDNFFSIFSGIFQDGNIPTITDLHMLGNSFKKEGDIKKALLCENLILLLRNSSVPLSCILGRGVSFGYGGIGVVVHANSKIGEFTKIGQNSTIGCGAVIGKRCAISPGVKIVKKITIGDYCIVGANAVVAKDIEPLSVCAGVPAKCIAVINKTNIHKYAKYLFKDLPVACVEEILWG